jgi:hypothetical protein
MTSRPELLTPSQKIAMDDLTRDGVARLAASGMRGAGRGGLAVLADAQGRQRARFYDTNQGRADNAAGVLHNAGQQARANASRIESATGANLANIHTGTAGANAAGITSAAAQAGGALQQAGQDQGNMWSASGDIAGQLLGSISALSNEDSKKLKSYPTLSGQV